MPEIELTPTLTIPEHLVGEVQTKLAYVDERIIQAEVAGSGDMIKLQLFQEADDETVHEIDEKVQRVVNSMVKGSFKPKVQVLEDFQDRPVPYRLDPHDELLARGELNQEATGIFALGPLVTNVIEYFETRFLELAGSFEAAQHR